MRAIGALVLVASTFAASPGRTAQAPTPITQQALSQIGALEREAESRTPAQRKIDSNLLYQSRIERGLPLADGVTTLRTGVTVDRNGTVAVEISAEVTPALLGELNSMRAEIIASVPAYRSVAARIPISALESLAGRGDVYSIVPHGEWMTNVFPTPAAGPYSDGGDLRTSFAERARNVRAQLSAKLPGFRTQAGSVTSEGDVTHRSDVARAVSGATGTGVKIGVMSNGIFSLAARQGTGDLPAVTVIPGQAGSGDEGTAMLEIVHDIAPGAQLFYATALPTITQFAQNVRDLRTAGCDIIIDDVTYFAETPFQDGQAPSVLSPNNCGVVIQAMNDVTADGAMCFSSAGNSGNKNDGTSGVWEGDFLDGGASAGPLPVGDRLHDFGGGVTQNVLTANGRVLLTWSDPLGGSGNDYNLYVLNAAGTAVVAQGNTVQDGNDDPLQSAGDCFTGERIVILKKIAAATRFLQLNTNRGRLTISTDGTTYGHNASRQVVSCAATPSGPAQSNAANGPYPKPFSPSNEVERFSSDGPRRIFFEADGTEITPGVLTAAGGELVQAPDLTAADGVTTTTPGFMPFFGTSAAAPHAGALFALLKSASPASTNAQILAAMQSTALDIEAPGTDRDAGSGIVMPVLAMRQLGVPGFALLEGVLTASEAPGNGNGRLEPGEGGTVQVELSSIGLASATGITATLSCTTPGVTISTPDARDYGSLPVGTAANAPTSWRVTLSNTVACSATLDFVLTVEYTGGEQPSQVLQLPYEFKLPISTTLDAVAPVSGEPNVVASTGTQTGRIARTLPASACGAPQPNPGLTAVTGARRYDAYTFVADATGCLEVTLTNQSETAFLHAVAYTGAFVPATPSLNYLGDPAISGFSGQASSFSVDVTQGQTYTVVVHEIDPGTGVGSAYDLTISAPALPSCAPPVNSTPTAVAQDVTADTDANCTADVAATAVDNNSSDPDGVGDIVERTLTPAGPYPLGPTSVTLTVTDSYGAQSQATATITVNNPAPTLTYAASAMDLGSTLDVLPATGPSDANGSVVTIAVQSPGTYTGTVSVDEFGKVSFSSPAPVGNHTITIRATDNCGEYTDADLALEVRNQVAVTVTTVPAGLAITVDGNPLTSPQSFVWVPASDHTIATTTPQSGTPGTQYVFANWSDAGAISHTVTVPGAPVTYTANFTTQHLLTTNADPAAGGTITPATGYQNAGNVIVTASANSGYVFTGFSGALTGATNPQTLDLQAPASVTANFAVQPTTGAVIDNRVSASSDDAEENNSSGGVALSSGDLELMTDGSTAQTVGIRFRSLTIPKGATITAAWIQFAAEGSHSGATSVSFRAQRHDNAPTFTSSTRNISNRTSLTPTVIWNLNSLPWTAGQSGSAQQSPDLTPLVQEIVNRPGWASGNALAFILTGSGRRNAYSYDGSPSRAPLLHIEYEISSNLNRAPVVDAGPNQTITMPTSVALLNGTVSDDGRPTVPGAVTTTWEMDSGPAPVAFGDANSVDTDATFTQAGTYVLKLTANDGALITSDVVTITVLPGGVVVQRRVSSSSDDAEQKSSSVNLTSSDLDLVTDSTPQTVGMRFTNLAIPRNATITHAHVTFRAREAQSGGTSIVFQAQATDNAPTFTTSSNNITNRFRTTGAPAWTPGSWAINSLQQTSELKNVIQAVVSRSGWSSGNAIVLIATGSGHRSAFSYDGGSSSAPLLYVEYTTAPSSTNRPPVVNAGPGHTLTLPPGSVLLDATVSDDGLPTPAAPTVTWSKDSGPGTATFASPNAVDTKVTFDQVGTYVLKLTASDGALSASDSCTIHVQPPPGSAIVLERRPAASSDDAEESSGGSVSLSSSDLELVEDGSAQVVGIRFPSLAIPRGAQILSAWVQFTADEIQNGTTNLTIQGEASDNSAPFTSATRNVSSRSRTTETAAWSPDPWPAIDVSTTLHRTTDLSSIVQRIVGRPGWNTGNALSVIVTGTGRRTAEAYDGSPTRAPLLHVEYTTAPALAQRLAASQVLPATTRAWAAPNPFRGAGTLRLALSQPGAVALRIFDVQGRQVGGTIDYPHLDAGEHRLPLGNGGARSLGAGMYFYQLATPAASLRGRFVVIE